MGYLSQTKGISQMGKEERGQEGEWIGEGETKEKVFLINGAYIFFLIGKHRISYHVFHNNVSSSKEAK